MVLERISMNILPEIEVQTIAIKVKPKAERMIKRGHPWVFEDAIVKQNKSGASGDIVIIFGSKDNKFIACGLYDPHSPIRVKLLQHGKGAKINSDFFAKKVKLAFDKRKPLLETATIVIVFYLERLMPFLALLPMFMLMCL